MPNSMNEQSNERLARAQVVLTKAFFPDCMICMSASRTTRFDCGHLVSCDECSSKLADKGRGCPVCRAPISITVFTELPPVPGRQPTFESVDVALQRLIWALTGDDLMAQQEAAFGLCVRAQEQESQGFERLIQAGVLKPLISVLAAGSNAAKSCAALTMGLLAPVASAEILAAGSVAALLGSLSASAESNGEYAALALSNLAEQDRDGTAAAILAEGGCEPLVAVLIRDDLDVAVLEASAGALVNLTSLRVSSIDGGSSEWRAAVAQALEPSMSRLRSLAGGNSANPAQTVESRAELTSAAATLLGNVERLLVQEAPVAGVARHAVPRDRPKRCLIS